MKLVTSVTMAALCAMMLPAVSANPLIKRQNQTTTSNASPSLSDSMGPAKYWVPAVAVGIILIVLAISCWCRRKARRTLTASVANTDGISAQTTANTAANSGASRPNRSRRPRRTPSQISTRSLPEYMKEPGAQELVIFRGREDMEDGTVVETDPANPRVHSIRLSTYRPYPESPQDEGLLDSRAPDGRTPSTGGHSSADLPTDQTVDERGEAPPYPGDEDADMNASTPLTSPVVQPPTPSTTQPNHRASGFRSLFSRFSTVGHRDSVLPTTVEGRENSLSIDSFRPTHQAQNSTGSGLSHMWRGDSRNRQSQIANMTSPSMISLNSISAPLSHTLVRSDVTYPTGGPTPDQMKVLSSLESFSKFGKPYGDAAIAFAASSRHDLENPPPEFETTDPATRESVDSDSVMTAEGAIAEEIVTRPPGLSTDPEAGVAPESVELPPSPASFASIELGARRSEDIDATASSRSSFVSAVSHLSDRTVT